MLQFEGVLGFAVSTDLQTDIGFEIALVTLPLMKVTESIICVAQNTMPAACQAST
jgi:hypothetical protein